MARALPVAPAALRRFIAAGRRGTLATVAPDGRPRLVPICFVADEDAAPGVDPSPSSPVVLYSAIDEKPKRAADPFRLARVRDLRDRPRAAVLVDRWDEDWERLAWVRLECHAEILSSGEREGDRTRAIAALRAKYPQYRDQRLEERPLIRLDCEVAAAWGDLAGGPAGSGGAERASDVEAM